MGAPAVAGAAGIIGGNAAGGVGTIGLKGLIDGSLGAAAASTSGGTTTGIIGGTAGAAAAKGIAIVGGGLAIGTGIGGILRGAYEQASGANTGINPYTGTELPGLDIAALGYSGGATIAGTLQQHLGEGVSRFAIGQQMFFEGVQGIAEAGTQFTRSTDIPYSISNLPGTKSRRSLYCLSSS